MHLRHRLALLGVFTAVGIALAILMTLTSVQAGPTTVFGPPTEGQKVILADTSIDGPALWTSPTGTTRAILAWTGTDASHRLNSLTSTDGLSFTNKHTLSETSLWRPAIAAVSTDANPTVELAWTGTDGAHHINLLSGVPGQGYTKVTLPELSFTAPALALNGGTVYLAWTGTDPNRSINIVPVLWRGGLSVGTKVILPQFSSISRPNLAFDPASKQLLLSYTAASGRIHFATSPDGAHWSVPSSSPLLEWSDVSPTMVGFATNNMPRYFVSWRGIDGAHSLNMQYTESFPRWPLDDSKATLAEACFGGPTLGFVGTYRQVLVAWTGVDASHHLNIAVVSM
jgi:hypothetical protein